MLNQRCVGVYTLLSHGIPSHPIPFHQIMILSVPSHTIPHVPCPVPDPTCRMMAKVMSLIWSDPGTTPSAAAQVAR